MVVALGQIAEWCRSVAALVGLHAQLWSRTSVSDSPVPLAHRLLVHLAALGSASAAWRCLPALDLLLDTSLAPRPGSLAAACITCWLLVWLPGTER